MSASQSQEYLGNGNHDWEEVTVNVMNKKDGNYIDATQRLRVPGGWLYRVLGLNPIVGLVQNVTFVPMPEVVKHKV
jgi:hypothetical protein